MLPARGKPAPPANGSPPDEAAAPTSHSSTAAEDSYFNELIASLPDSVDVPDVPQANGSPLNVGRPPDNWKPRHTLEAAVEKLSPAIRETLEARLGGSFREIRRYTPSRSVQQETSLPKAPEPEEAVSVDEDQADED